MTRTIRTIASNADANLERSSCINVNYRADARCAASRDRNAKGTTVNLSSCSTSMETQILIAAFVLGPALAAVLAYDAWALCVTVRRRYVARIERCPAGAAAGR